MANRIGLFLLNRRPPEWDAMRAELAALFALLGIADDERPGPIDGPRGHVETVVDATGRIVVPEGVAPVDVSTAIREYWPREIWGDAARVSYRESAGWDHVARRNTTGDVGGTCNVFLGYLDDGTAYYSEDSIGLFQINRCAHGGTVVEWENVERNVRKARELYDSAGGWSPWVYTATHLGLMEEGS